MTMPERPRLEYNKDSARLLSKVSINAATSCWEWTGHLDISGYGKIRVSGKSRQAHRILWGMMYGGIPSGGACLMHRCDNPKCVNPTHLKIGDHLANMRDMVAKGRQARGSSNGRARLNESDVEAIRAMTRTGRWQIREIGRMFGVDEVTIHHANIGKSWAHLPGANKKVQNV